MLGSCSIKEMRLECPCTLEIDYSQFGKVARRVYLDLDGQISDREITSQDSLITSESIHMTQSSFQVRIWSGISRTEASSMILDAPEGEEADSLFLFCTAIPGNQEIVRIEAVPHKQFANVLLQVFSSEEDTPYINYTVRSDYGSIDLSRGTSLPGSMSIPLGSGSQDRSFRMPRQNPGSKLVLEVEDVAGNIFSYPLGEWILNAGYDWNAVDLDDIIVGADFYTGVFHVSVVDWDMEEAKEEML